MTVDSPCVLILVDFLGVGGMERQIIELLRALHKNDRFRVVLGVLDHGGKRENEAFELVDTILPIKRRARFDITPPIILLNQVKTNKVRLIHAFGWMSALTGLLAARWFHIPIINGSIREAPPKLFLRHKISRWVACRSDAIVSNSKAGLQAYGLSHHPRSRVIYNGVDFGRFKLVVPTSYNEPVLCMVANFSPKKDQRSLIFAMPIIKKEFPQARLVFVGQDMGTLSGNRQLAAELGLSSAVSFVTDTIHPEPYIAGSNICILTSNSEQHGEGISNSILEYMALGKPVIATDFAGNRETIVHGETGFLVLADSAESIALQVIDLLQSPALAQKVGHASQLWVKEKFSLERMTADYEALYKSLLSS